VGQITPPSSGVVYVDANVVIFRVEQIEPHLSTSEPLWSAMERGVCPVVSSTLTLMEVLVKPLRVGDPVLVALFRNVLLSSAGFTCVPVSQLILESAAQLRATYRLRTPDAIHAATALSENCSLFVTNDQDFKRVPGLNVAVLSDVAAS
jgi:predicted nucleic acid-binding protein